eukprot:768689-Hanusia_phi.AAC.1
MRTGCNSGYLTMSIAYMFQVREEGGGRREEDDKSKEEANDCFCSARAKKVKKNIKWGEAKAA